MLNLYTQFSPRLAVQALIMALLCAIATSSLAQQAQETRTYQLENRSASDMAEQVKALYQQAPVTVTARGQQLMVRGEPVLLDEIGTLVNSLDVPPVQMRISVRYTRDASGDRSEGGVSVSKNRASASIQQSSGSSRSTREHNLVVQDGQSAHITSGNVRTLPFAIKTGRNPATVLEQVETRSGFVVSPQAISDQAVELKILSFEEDPAELPGYETEALMTIRRVEPGQWVSLGSANRSERSQNSSIGLGQNNSLSESTRVDVKVEILP
jgi:type II secretory pathway component HofQ